MDMEPEDIIDLHRKRNRVEHCFRTINTMDIAFLLYHWTPQNIRVHMFFSIMACFFLALISNEIHSKDGSVSLISIRDYLRDININYAASRRSATWRIECKSDISELLVKTMHLEAMVKN